MYCAVVTWVDTIQSEAQSAHIHMPLWEMLYSGRIADVSCYLMFESIHKFTAGAIKQQVLLLRETIMQVVISTDKMCEYAAWSYSLLFLQNVYQLIYFADRVKPKTVHAGVKFDVYRMIYHTFSSCSLY